jgi:hypothetical protein
MAKSKLFIVYDSRNIGLEDVIPESRFIRYSKKHDSNYIVILVQNLSDKSLIRQIIMEKYKPDLFNLLKRTIIHSDYKLHVTKEFISESPIDNFVYTRLVCDFIPGSSSWTQRIEETTTYNDLYNFL